MGVNELIVFKNRIIFIFSVYFPLSISNKLNINCLTGWGSAELDSVWQNYFERHLRSKGTIYWRMALRVHAHATEAEGSEMR